MAAGQVVAFLALICVLMWFTFVRPHKLVTRWFAANGFLVRSCKMCWFRRGGFPFALGDKRMYYRLELRDVATGRLRRAHARVGSYALGLFSNTVEVLWDDERDTGRNGRL